ncbi:DUF7482 domain-containing protein [Chitinimonas sp. BJB300]|uniref:DUF7482 domain-containing protein n=1 Tax=Chitinimonas sp. BJB300 TaxID=1559339 RepID=UPI000C0FE611|nr:hypothetical protein [Chitinimonas sp. BJB300]PHV10994.1 hypothetical protein CSQ89_13290 [Chitinimonas sp. BJB300]TSJ87550.1 hypothetical protein FG002_013565 [Chitinimonas sp. BJB300]
MHRTPPFAQLPIVCGRLSGLGAGAVYVRNNDQDIVLPLVAGWFKGTRVHYVTTDISDRIVAGMVGANWVGRLDNVLPADSTQPGYHSALDRVYKFAPGMQDSVLPSVSTSQDSDNQDSAYGTLWQVVMVHWQPNRSVRLLKSEQAVIAAEDAGDVLLEPLPIIVNCPVVGEADRFD